jgi:phage gp46-like protein
MQESSPSGPAVAVTDQRDFFSDPTHAGAEAFRLGLRQLAAHQRPLDGPSLEALLRGIQSNPNAPALISQIMTVAANTQDEPAKALSIYQSLLTLPIPAEPGSARQNWLGALNNALILSFTLKDFELSARMADSAQAYATENPYIFHSAACSYVAVGALDKAMNQVKLAVKYHYAHLDKLQVDTDLGPLLDRPDFIALFPKQKHPASH